MCLNLLIVALGIEAIGEHEVDVLAVEQNNIFPAAKVIMAMPCEGHVGEVCNPMHHGNILWEGKEGEHGGIKVLMMVNKGISFFLYIIILALFVLSLFYAIHVWGCRLRGSQGT